MQSSLPPQTYKNFMPAKQELIDFAFQRMNPAPRSFADLGGAWNVDAAYTFYTLDTYAIDRAVLVDTNLRRPVVERVAQHPNLETVAGNFGNVRVAQQIGSVDLLFFFDVLLHQASPDWDDVLELYAPRAQYMAIFNQQYLRNQTHRLLDLGREEYFRLVPRDPENSVYCNLFDKLDEFHPEHQRPWRHIHNIWQWGITDEDLIHRMKRLGYRLQYFVNHGRFRKLRYFENHAFLFKRVRAS